MTSRPDLTDGALREVEAAFRSYMNAYFRDRDLERTLALLSDTLTGFGTGVDEIGLAPGEFHEFYRRDIANAPGSIRVSTRKLKSTLLSPSIALVSCVIDIATTIEDQPFEAEGLRYDTVFRLEDGRWMLVHKHVSAPWAEHEEGEAYPLQKLREQKRLLEEQVRERTLALEERNRELAEALSRVKQLEGLIPICANCKKVREDTGYWQQIEVYIRHRSEAEFSHGLCPECTASLYPEFADDSEPRRGA